MLFKMTGKVSSERSRQEILHHAASLHVSVNDLTEGQLKHFIEDVRSRVPQDYPIKVNVTFIVLLTEDDGTPINSL